MSRRPWMFQLRLRAIVSMCTTVSRSRSAISSRDSTRAVAALCVCGIVFGVLEGEKCRGVCWWCLHDFGLSSIAVEQQ